MMSRPLSTQPSWLGIRIGTSATYERMRIFRAKLTWDKADKIYSPNADTLCHVYIYT
jgi:hypothetical protein